MQRLLEEVEYILSMFNKVVKESYPGYSSTGITTMTGEQLKFYNFVLPDIHVSQYLGIPAHTSRIYFIDEWDGAVLETVIAHPDLRHNSAENGLACHMG